LAYLKINNRIITTSIKDILLKLRTDTGNRYLHDIYTSHSGLRITCPFHAEGNEKTPDCFINDNPDSDLYGVFHCFACGAKGFITDIVNKCFDEEGNFGENWLVDNFASVFIERQEILPEISLDKPQTKYLDNSEIDKYKYFHPYMFRRHLTEDVIRKFSIGYDSKDDSIVFPVWDENDKLLFFTKRSVKGKNFFIPGGVIKPIYLLNFIIKEHITNVIVTESQINALTACS
jgi:DNA primase